MDRGVPGHRYNTYQVVELPSIYGNSTFYRELFCELRRFFYELFYEQ